MDHKRGFLVKNRRAAVYFLYAKLTSNSQYIDAQNQTPLPIWRPETNFKYPDGGDLETEAILRFIGTLPIVSSPEKSGPRCCHGH
jgi:hypothetical protein